MKFPTSLTTSHTRKNRISRIKAFVKNVRAPANLAMVSSQASIIHSQNPWTQIVTVSRRNTLRQLLT